tara:strand:+ start:166 stop:468 length:303 start_codon:yes stop_codon:yes gene_type:complete
MSVEIILSKVPMPHGKNSTCILRVDDPYNVTWEQIFTFCEEKSTLPRRFMRACNFDGKWIMGKFVNEEKINYDKFRLCSQNGEYISTALISMEFTSWGNN